MPSLLGKTGPNQKAETKRNSDGTTTSITPEEAMRDALERFENSTVVVVKNGAEVEPMEASGKGEQFEKGFNVSGKQITLALLKQELATRDAAHQTKGSTGSQMSLLDVQVWRLKNALVAAFVNDVIKPLVRVNFGDWAVAFMPKVSMGDSERKDWATDSTAVVALISATVTDEDGNIVPALTYSQIESLLTQIGIPAPTEDEVKAMRDRKEQLKLQKQKQQSGGQQGNDQQKENADEEKKAA